MNCVGNQNIPQIIHLLLTESGIIGFTVRAFSISVCLIFPPVSAVFTASRVAINCAVACKIGC